MNRNRLLTGLLFALVVALLTSVFVYRAFKQASAMPRSVSTQSVVVAAEPLELGTRLDASKLRLIPWPSGAPIEGMYTRVEDCVNRALITSVAENEPILKTKVASADSGAGLSATIPEGMRAISVAVNDVIGVAGFVTPGTMVDILVTGQSGTGNQTVNITRTILENIRVLAAGQKVEQDRDGKPQTVSVITVLVSPTDATKLALASTEGKIQLALRNTVDTKETDPPAVLQSSLFSGAEPAPPKPVVEASTRRRTAAPAPAAPPPPPAPYTVEVITGTHREEKSFPNQ